MAKRGRLKHGKVPDWLARYIELKSDLSNEMSEKEIAEACGITQFWLYAFKRKHPEVQKIVNDNLKKQEEFLWERARKLAYNRMKKSDKILQVVLEMTGQHNNPESVNRYMAMSRDMLIAQIKAKLNGLDGLKTLLDEKVPGMDEAYGAPRAVQQDGPYPTTKPKVVNDTVAPDNNVITNTTDLGDVDSIIASASTFSSKDISVADKLAANSIDDIGHVEFEEVEDTGDTIEENREEHSGLGKEDSVNEGRKS